MSFQSGWVRRLRENLEAAVANGELPPDTDLDQLTYDLTAYLVPRRTRGSCSTATTAASRRPHGPSGIRLGRA